MTDHKIGDIFRTLNGFVYVKIREDEFLMVHRGEGDSTVQVGNIFKTHDDGWVKPILIINLLDPTLEWPDYFSLSLNSVDFKPKPGEIYKGPTGAAGLCLVIDDKGQFFNIGNPNRALGEIAGPLVNHTFRLVGNLLDVTDWEQFQR